MVYRRFRVREELYRAIHYIEWKLLFTRSKEDIKYIADEIISESLTKIERDNIKIITSDYGTERELIGLTLAPETIKNLYDIHEKSRIFVGELIEVCVYMYFQEHFTEEDFKLNQLQNWDIVLIKIG